jgi:hypothetical protein
LALKSLSDKLRFALTEAVKKLVLFHRRFAANRRESEESYRLALEKHLAENRNNIANRCDSALSVRNLGERLCVQPQISEFISKNPSKIRTFFAMYTIYERNEDQQKSPAMWHQSRKLTFEFEMTPVIPRAKVQDSSSNFTSAGQHDAGEWDRSIALDGSFLIGTEKTELLGSIAASSDMLKSNTAFSVDDAVQHTHSTDQA